MPRWEGTLSYSISHAGRLIARTHQCRRRDLEPCLNTGKHCTMGKSAFSSASPQAYHRPPFLRGVQPHSRGPLGLNSVITRRFSLRLLAGESPQSTDHTGSLGDVNFGSAHPHAQLSRSEEHTSELQS